VRRDAARASPDPGAKRLRFYPSVWQPRDIQTPCEKLRVMLPMHSRDIPTGTLHAILKDAGLKSPGR